MQKSFLTFVMVFVMVLSSGFAHADGCCGCGGKKKEAKPSNGDQGACVRD